MIANGALQYNWLARDCRLITFAYNADFKKKKKKKLRS